MKDHMKPSMRKKLNDTILHAGTKDMNSDRPPDLIANSIVDLAITLKKNSQSVSVFNIITRNGNCNDKTAGLNNYLKQSCIEKNIILIDLTKTIYSKTFNISTSQVILI